MTEQTTTIPTPARDAYVALREQHNAEFAVFSEHRTSVLSASLSKDEAIDRVMDFAYEARSYWTKKTAIEEIVASEWAGTEMAQRTNAAERLADREGAVVRRIARTGDITWHEKKMRDALDDETTRYNSERVLRIALDLQRAMLESNWWDRVRKHVTESGVAPLLALANIRVQALEMALGRWEDPLSRSTSVAANITKDQQRYSATLFLEETKDLVRED